MEIVDRIVQVKLNFNNIVDALISESVKGGNNKGDKRE